jgi:prepilin-type N-terminal cleavage/methylation domain-containing protein
MFKKTNGLTLIELVVSLALIGLVLQVVYSLFLMGYTTFDYSSNKTFAQQEVRLLSDVVNSELKYVTNMTTDPTVVEEHFLGNYYSMELEIVNDIPVLIRKYYEDDGEDYIVTEKRTAGCVCSL